MFAMSENASGESTSADTPRECAGAVIVATVTSQRPDDSPDLPWAPVMGAPLLAWAVRAFEAAAGVTDVVLVVVAARGAEARELARREGWRKTRVIATETPGWRDAVRMGLDALPPECAWVVLHEGARPLVTPDLIAEGLETARDASNGSAAAYEPVNETIKRARDGVVVETPARAGLALLQTPQVVRREALVEALAAGVPAGDPEKAASDVTDTAILLLGRGRRVALFRGGHENVKVRGADEIAIVESVLRQRQADVGAVQSAET